MGLLWRTATNHIPGDDPEDYGVPYARGADDHLHEFARVKVPEPWTLHPDDEVYATQHYIDPDHPAIKHYDPDQAEQGGRPSVVSMNGDLYIDDGHHRICGARKAGQPIDVDVWHPGEDDG
jgi:hypothetical protein